MDNNTELTKEVNMSIEDVAELADRINDIVPAKNQVAGTTTTSAAVTPTSDSDLKIIEEPKGQKALGHHPSTLFVRKLMDGGSIQKYSGLHTATHRYCPTIVDRFTRWPEALPLTA